MFPPNRGKHASRTADSRTVLDGIENGRRSMSAFCRQNGVSFLISAESPPPTRFLPFSSNDGNAFIATTTGSAEPPFVDIAFHRTETAHRSLAPPSKRFFAIRFASWPHMKPMPANAVKRHHTAADGDARMCVFIIPFGGDSERYDTIADTLDAKQGADGENDG